jgi:hypothetical protein
MLIPYLCPELPPVQKDALRKSVKTPLVFTSVALRNWPAFDKLKLHLFWCIWYARRAGRACRSTTKIARDARNARHVVRNIRTQYSRPDWTDAAYTDAAIDQGHRAIMELLDAERHDEIASMRVSYARPLYPVKLTLSAAFLKGI